MRRCGHIGSANLPRAAAADAAPPAPGAAPAAAPPAWPALAAATRSGVGAADDAALRGRLACAGVLSAAFNWRRRPAPEARSPAQQRAFEPALFRGLGLVGARGLWEAWRLPQVCRELRLPGFGGSGAADAIRDGLEQRGVWAELRAARAATRDAEGCTALLRACDAAAEDVQRVCELVELGAPGIVNARNRAGCTSLVVSSWRGHAAVVSALLAAGASVDDSSPRGWTPLICACLCCREAAADVLVAAGADVNSCASGGDTPLNLARGRHRRASPVIEALLLLHGATRV
jgi:hypothetical protein